MRPEALALRLDDLATAADSLEDLAHDNLSRTVDHHGELVVVVPEAIAKRFHWLAREVSRRANDLNNGCDRIAEFDIAIVVEAQR